MANGEAAGDPAHKGPRTLPLILSRCMLTEIGADLFCSAGRLCKKKKKKRTNVFFFAGVRSQKPGLNTVLSAAKGV